MKKALKIIVFFLIGLGFIWWFVSKLSQEEINQMRACFHQANYFWFFVAILINVFASYIRAKRWQLLLSPMGYKPKTLSCFLAVVCGYLANLAVPRLGEIMRCGLLRNKEKVPFEKAVGTVIVERAVDMILFLLIILLALFMEFNYIKDYLWDNFSDKFNFSSWKYYLIFAFIGFIGLLLLFFIFRKRLEKTKIYIKLTEILKGLWEGIVSIKNLDRPFLFIFHSLLIWLLWIFGTYIIFLCLQETSHLAFHIAIITTVLGAIGPMLTPGGIGIFPAIIAQTLSIYSIAMPVGYASGWLLWIVSQLGTLVIGLFGFVYFSHNKKV